MRPAPARFVGTQRTPSGARVVILGAALERTVSFRGGPAQAPAAIRSVSASLETYSHLFGVDLNQVGVADIGDIDCEAPLSEALGRIEHAVADVLRQRQVPIVLGGEHTVAWPAVRAAASLGPVQVVALDAHSDLRDTYLGASVSHATVLRRCLEVVDSLHIVGARSLYGGERHEPHFVDPKALPKALHPHIPIWLTLDLDVLDPGQCPGVTNPEPGGLGYLDVIDIFRTLRGRSVLGMDVVELAPPFDPSGVSAICAAKLVIEACCALWGNP